MRFSRRVLGVVYLIVVASENTMINYGDLPVVNKCGEQIGGPRDFPPSLVHLTACIHDHSGCNANRVCHRCNRSVSVFVSKPGSPYVWCLACW